MTKRSRETLFNPTWEEMVESDPLLAFSFYLSGRVNVLLDLGDDIVALLDEGFAADCAYADKIERASTIMWLWTLGAFEVVRTICQASSCFSPSAQTKFKSLKKSLSMARMPAAKMEIPGKKAPVSSDRSPDGWDVDGKDLLVGDPMALPHISARTLLKEFGDVFASLSKADVLGRHENSYSGSHS
ncbi:hypothetical protein [Magnetospirillum fulvum]|uniref:hypothetical protein n=1 Tax=Magnetospirillum fulvum TaxID=1082 RepID=UPI000945A69C|nr:hypothetical protein [Magnetospirillum fulvum]